MKRIVFDASARIETLARPELAGTILADHDACAPTLIRWEIGNVVHGKNASTFGDLAKRKQIVSTLLRPLRLVDQEGREDAIGYIVSRTGLTFYDAAYLQLAIDEDARLLTEDKRLAKVAVGVLGNGRVVSLDGMAESVGDREA